ncbi:MAG: 30S ribosomal protein S3 [Candidatus Aenigmarchaeota archaeon]|nr:30S ribosomal protein S3 [Candidatus Aenigmarchaeota archaeon]
MIDILLNRHFVNQSINGLKMQEFIEEYLKGEIFSDIELERTPLGLRIIISTSRPGRIIGAGGRKINGLADEIKRRFNVENPQVDVKTIKNPDMDARLVAKQIAFALETGNKHKKVGNLFMKRVMDAGALGVQIVIGGKLGGSKGRTDKFARGYIKYCGDTAKTLVDHGFAEALTRPGKIGVQVKIMKYFMDTFGNIMTKKDIMDAKAAAIQEVIEAKKETDYEEEAEDIDNLDDEIDDDEEKPKKRKVVVPKKEKKKQTEK